jgi:hypothetical protein
MRKASTSTLILRPAIFSKIHGIWLSKIAKLASLLRLSLRLEQFCPVAIARLGEAYMDIGDQYSWQ